MIVQKLNEKEIEEIEKLELITFKENAYLKNEIINFNNSDNFIFVIKKDIEKIIGYAILYLSIDEIEIYKICVSNFYRKKNIGSSIIEDIKKLKKNIVIEVSNRDYTKIFYEKNNFKIINLRKNYYYDKSDALIMKWEFKNN